MTNAGKNDIIFVYLYGRMIDLANIPELFASRVFSDEVMRNRLPKDAYKSLKKTIAKGEHLNAQIASVVANAMKDWAVENGATHYTHWFQPMTGVTAEKHDSFISPDGEGKIIMDFSGKELIKGEPDASSFPSGGIRATFEARGYTAWDPTSYAFIKDKTLCIPTAFCSYGGEALDKKTPLLRSMEAIEKQAKRILKLFGKDVERVLTTVGPEQEYFLIDKSVFDKRPDLIYCKRTLIGARPPKGQELDDHYFGVIKPRVSAYMKELDAELWSYGVLAKTKHNEVAPAQHELAPIFTTTNIAADHNQLTMEVMQSVAQKHDMVCLLHEKPFNGVNGSGKHNNWSLTTSDGENLLEPGKTPSQNAQFLLFLTAVIKAVNDYQDLLRVSVASAGNDHRLGANEAPPAIISVFLGDDLEAVLNAIETGEDFKDRGKIKLGIGATVLPDLPQDTTDRNRTSPFAFTGNKFEFRSLGSASSISDSNVVINTAVAEILEEFADKLEASADFEADLNELIKNTYTENKRIIFNGNNYSEEWVEEAERRGLLNLKSTVDALPRLVSDKNKALFRKHGVYTDIEVEARYEIKLETYSKIIRIEALTMIDMVKKGVVPAVNRYQGDIADIINKKRAAVADIDCSVEEKLLHRISTLNSLMFNKLSELETEIMNERFEDTYSEAKYYHDEVFAVSNELRIYVDALELLLGKDYWPYPSYAEILYSIK